MGTEGTTGCTSQEEAHLLAPVVGGRLTSCTGAEHKRGLRSWLAARALLPQPLFFVYLFAVVVCLFVPHPLAVLWEEPVSQAGQSEQATFLTTVMSSAWAHDPRVPVNELHL